MRVTMIKKRFADGHTCEKCAQAEDLLRRRGLFDRVDRVVWADETDASSEGMRLAAQYGVSLAPFFLVEEGGQTSVYTSVLKLVALLTPPSNAASASGALDVEALNRELGAQSPQEIVERALSLFGGDCVIAFSGAEDVALLDMAKKTGRAFRVLTLDTGRLHAETYRFLERVRAHFGIEIEVMFPDAVAVESLVRKKGLFSFYEDGHGECCNIRKVAPLARALSGYRAWMTGQRRDQSPTRSDVHAVERDLVRRGAAGELVKFNPLAAWSLSEVWRYIREQALPYNALHEQGFISIGCEPCTRAVRPGEHERAGRWWWEEATQRECGLHVAKV